MKPKLRTALLFAGLVAISALADEPKSPAAPLEPPDKAKVSYALGMNMGNGIKSAKISIDLAVVEKALRDVLDGKPTELSDSEILALMEKGRAAGLAQEAQADKHKVSYAMGMHLAMQLRRSAADVDIKDFAQGLKDVIEDKPTRFSQTEIPTLFRQAQAYNRSQASKKNKTEGAAFLAKNAQTPGITVLPSGLQYRILEAGTGKVPTTNDLIFIKYRGSLVDGHEFDHNNHFLVQTTGGILGWQQALQRMRVGAKWQIFVPSELAFRQYGEPIHQVGPDATVIYELEMLEIVQPNDPRVGVGRLGHGMEEDLPQTKTSGTGKGN